ncbi:MAG: hypothetical protein V3R73_02145 [Sphingomonadales bacterium]
MPNLLKQAAVIAEGLRLYDHDIADVGGGETHQATLSFQSFDFEISRCFYIQKPRHSQFYFGKAAFFRWCMSEV